MTTPHYEFGPFQTLQHIPKIFEHYHFSWYLSKYSIMLQLLKWFLLFGISIYIFICDVVHSTKSTHIHIETVQTKNLKWHEKWEIEFRNCTMTTEAFFRASVINMVLWTFLILGGTISKAAIHSCVVVWSWEYNH